MNCESVKANLALLLYGELSVEEEDLVEDHLSACAGCRKALEAEKALHRLMDQRERVPSPALLAHCRKDLDSQIRLASPRPGWREWLQRSFQLPMLRPVGALGLLAVGFLAARLTLPTVSLAPVAQPVVSRIRSVQPMGQDRVQIVLDETRERVMDGRMEDEPIRRLLLAAAKDSSDPSLRGESMNLLKTRGESPEVRRALLQALQHDPNPGVRLKALEGLKSYSQDTDVRAALADALLQDDNPGVRTQAIDLLIQKKEDALVGVLQEAIQKENNNYVRLRCQRALADMNASIGTF